MEKRKLARLFLMILVGVYLIATLGYVMCVFMSNEELSNREFAEKHGLDYDSIIEVSERENTTGKFSRIDEKEKVMTDKEKIEKLEKKVWRLEILVIALFDTNINKGVDPTFWSAALVDLRKENK